jgi:hypothetical protein
MGSGEISRAEFRQALRNPKMGIPKELLAIASIDALFDSLDEDHGGTLDLQEMKSALQSWKQRASERKAMESQEKETAKRYDERKEQVEQCLVQTKEYEKAEKELQDAQAALATLVKKEQQELEKRKKGHSEDPTVIRQLEKEHQHVLDEEKRLSNIAKELKKIALVGQATLIKLMRDDEEREIIRKKAETEASEIAKLAMLKDREAARARRAAKAAALAQEKLDFEERVSKKRESRAWRAPGAAAGGRATSSTAGAPAMAPIPSYADTGPSVW